MELSQEQKLKLFREMHEIDPAFRINKLNDIGLKRSVELSKRFSEFAEFVYAFCDPENEYRSLAGHSRKCNSRMEQRLQEAYLCAQAAIESNPYFQEEYN